MPLWNEPFQIHRIPLHHPELQEKFLLQNDPERDTSPDPFMLILTVTQIIDIVQSYVENLPG